MDYACPLIFVELQPQVENGPKSSVMLRSLNFTGHQFFEWGTPKPTGHCDIPLK